MSKEQRDKNKAETDAVPENPVPEVKPVSEASVASVKLEAFSDATPIYISDDGGKAISESDVYSIDGAVGGQANNVSQDVGRSSGSGNYGGPGFNPVDKINREEALAYDNTAAPMTTFKLVGADDDFKAPVSTNYKADHTRQMKSVSCGESPRMGQPYRRTMTDISVDKTVFIRGQIDGASPSLGYPTQTIGFQRNGSTGVVEDVVDVDVNIPQGNYRIDAMNFVIGDNGQLSNVTFDVTELGPNSDGVITSSPEALDYLPDHALLLDNIAQKKVDEWSTMINQKGNDFFSPIASGIRQPIRHARLVNDIKASDGAIVYAAVKSMMEAYAYGLWQRRIMGGSSGSIRLASMMIADDATSFTRLASNIPHWTEIGGTIGSDTTSGNFPTSFNVHTFMNLFQSPRTYNGYFGNLIQQIAFQNTFKNALKFVDKLGWKIDKDTLALFDQTYGWYNDEEENVKVGVRKYDIVLPYNPNDYFTYAIGIDGRKELEGACHIQNSTTVSDGAISMIGSDLFSGMVKYFQEVFLPRIVAALRYDRKDACNGKTIKVPFDFRTDGFTFGQFFIANAMASITALDGDKYINGAYRQFKESYGVDPYDDDVTVPLTLANIVGTASFRGLGTDPVFTPASDGLKMLMSDPEFISVALCGTTGGVTGGQDGTIIVYDHPMVGHFDRDSLDKYTCLRPVLQESRFASKGMTRFLRTDALTYICSRSQPIAPYPLAGAGSARTVNPFETEGVMNVNGLFVMGNVRAMQVAKNTPVTLTKRTVLGVPRFGRIAPCPPGSMNRQLVFAKITGEGQVIGGTARAASRPIEAYHVNYLWLDDEATRRYGGANYYDSLRVNTAYCCDSATDSPVTLASQYGIYIDSYGRSTNYSPAIPKTNLGSPQGVSNGWLVDMTPAMFVWQAANRYPFLFGPTAGAILGSSTDSDSQIGVVSVDMDSTMKVLISDEMFDLQLHAAFGLKYFACEYYNRYAMSVIEQLDSMNNMVTDNNLERTNNILIR